MLERQRGHQHTRPEDFISSQRFFNPVKGISARVDAAITRVDSVLTEKDRELDEVKKLQQKWNSTLGLAENLSGELDNYNPVLARWNFERLETDEQREGFRKNELQQITTALRERHNTQESRLQLILDAEGKIRNDAFPEEPYEAMLERGVAYREKQGSKDLAREKAEVKGFAKIQSILSDPETPLGTAFMVISPQSQIEDSPYSHKFIDGYQVDENLQTGERVINYVRFASSIDTDDYASISQRLDPTIFERKEQREQQTGTSIPLDAWYLENPFLIPAQEGQTIDTIFNDNFAMDVEATTEEEWKKLQRIYTPGMLYLLDQITKPDFDPEAIARAYNIMLLSPERNFVPESGEHIVFDAKSQKLNTDAYRYMAALAERHGHEQAEEREVGCGKSAGIKLGGSNVDMMLNSVSQFGKGTPEAQEWFSCPKCSFRADGPVGNCCPGCGLTKEAFAEESGISCD